MYSGDRHFYMKSCQPSYSAILDLATRHNYPYRDPYPYSQDRPSRFSRSESEHRYPVHASPMLYSRYDPNEPRNTPLRAFSSALGQSFSEYAKIGEDRTGRNRYSRMQDPSYYRVQARSNMAERNKNDPLAVDIIPVTAYDGSLIKSPVPVNGGEQYEEFRGNPNSEYFTDRNYPTTFFEEAPSVRDMIKKDY